MEKEITFFSYSRADSAFVLKLAKDLREKGSNICLEQLDIKPGNRWDNAIQSALNSAKTLIVVLSPTSVASENVMDEVSFAIVNKINIIRVLINQCITPFRLSRLQRIDFTGDYQAGLNTLIEVLDYHAASRRETASAPQEKNFAQADISETRPMLTGKENVPPGTINKKSLVKKYILLAASVVVIIVVVVMVMKLNTPPQRKMETGSQADPATQVTGTSYPVTLPTIAPDMVLVQERGGAEKPNE